MSTRNIFLWARIAILSYAFIFAGCATAPKAPLPIHGAEIETVQSPISIAAKTAGKSMGGRGYLIFKRPDRFHLAVTSPFGLTILEVFSGGDRLTCIIPSKNLAYTGLISELPDQQGLKNWAMMRWVVERPTVEGPPDGVTESATDDGRKQLLYYDKNGLLQRKLTEDGDEAVYTDYREANGTAFPGTIMLSNWLGDTTKITFDEPEVNQPVENEALTPNLEGMKVLPFSEFRGF